MKFSTLALLSACSFATADRTFNITSALEPGNFEKYRCLTTESWIKYVPECLGKCTIAANKRDGCEYDDFACHCVNYQVYSDLVEPCVFPPEAGGVGPGCTFAELDSAQPVVNDMCNFFNATLYAAYAGCSEELELSMLKTMKIVFDEDTVETE